MSLTSTIVDQAVRNSDSGGSSDTLTGLSIGTASSDRVVEFILGMNNAGLPSAMTLGGVTAQFLQEPGSLIWGSAPLTTGTTANLVVTGSGGFQVYGVWNTIG